eukprot:SAG22_NODE_58_length_23645_cov_16.637943_4_plen_77_part_00
MHADANELDSLLLEREDFRLLLRNQCHERVATMHHGKTNHAEAQTRGRLFPAPRHRQARVPAMGLAGTSTTLVLRP